MVSLFFHKLLCEKSNTVAKTGKIGYSSKYKLNSKSGPLGDRLRPRRRLFESLTVDMTQSIAQTTWR